MKIYQNTVVDRFLKNLDSLQNVPNFPFDLILFFLKWLLQIQHQKVSIKVHMAQNVLLIWLDVNINENSSDCQNTMAYLRRTINTIHTFTDEQECYQFLEDTTREMACMIISESFSQLMVPRMHNLSQVDSIFIFRRNKKNHEGWAKDRDRTIRRGQFVAWTIRCTTFRRKTIRRIYS